MHNLKWGHAFGGAESVDQHVACRSENYHQRLLLEKINTYLLRHILHQAQQEMECGLSRFQQNHWNEKRRW